VVSTFFSIVYSRVKLPRSSWVLYGLVLVCANVNLTWLQIKYAGSVECQPNDDLDRVIWIVFFAVRTRGEAVMKVSLRLILVSYVMVPITSFLRGKVIPVLVYLFYFVVEVVGVERSLRLNPIDRSDEGQWKYGQVSV
jgi:hypothetical protein